MAARPPTHPAHSLLARAHSPDTASEVFQSRVLQRPLILRPTSPEPNSQDARAARRKQRLLKKGHARRKQRPKTLSAKEKRILGVYEMRKEEIRWDVWKELWRMWVGYAWKVLGLKSSAAQQRGQGGRPLNPQVVGPIVASMDYHGAEVEVARCGCVGRVGTKGIVVRETKFTIMVVTRKNGMKTIPKKDSIFRIQIPRPQSNQDEMPPDIDQAQDNSVEGSPPRLVLEVHGSQIEFRPVDRATRKFKQRRMDAI